MYGVIGRVLITGVALSFAQFARADEAFDGAVAPFVQAHCVKCHGPTKQSGDFRIDKLQAGPNDAEKWREVRQQLRDGLMPPSREPRPESKASEKVVAWIEAELARNGKSTTRPQPQYGNDVPHEPLFDPANAKLPASTPARYWRLSPQIYKHALARQHPSGGSLVSPFNPLAGNGFKDYALPLTIDEPVAALLWINAEAVVNARLRLDSKGKFNDKGSASELGKLLDDSTVPTDPVLEKVLTTEFKQVTGRSITPEELRRWLSLIKKNIATAGTTLGTKMTLTALLLHPEAVYRKEIGDGKPDAHGRRMLSPHELAFATAYALGDTWPDTSLWKALEQGQLATREDVAREVNRLFDDPKFEKPRIHRFFQEYFGYRNAVNVFKTDFIHGLHLPADNVEDTDTLIRQIVNADKNVLAELLTCSDVVLITDRGGDKRHKPIYAYNFPEPLPDIKGQKRSRVPALAGQRAGILTQPSWLVAYSTNFDNHAIARGHWIRERLLGGTLPEIPLNVDAKLPDDKDKTLRQRMHVTREEYCWKCHQKMDPLGMPFEIYSHFGRFRETETVLDPDAPPAAKGKMLATRDIPVDASGEISGTGDATLDGPVKNAIEMMHKLGHSPRVEQVFIRHAFRYWMGRNETLSDAGTLQAAHKAYKDSGGSFRALVTSLLTSDSFLYRTGDAPPVPAIAK